MADVAMDLHKRHSQVATLDEWGEIRELRIEHDGDSRAMEKFLGGLESGSRIAIEANGSWWWLVDLVGEARARSGVIEPQEDAADCRRLPEE
jgi:hypothetical protein